MLKRAKQRYEELMLELACRKGNEHVGSGLGGNPAQYLTMLALTPNFSSVNSEGIFSVHDDSIDINVERIHLASRKEIRLSLDKVLTSDIIDKYAAPELVDFLSGSGPVPKDENLFASPKQKDLIKVARLASRMKELVELELKENSDVTSISNLSPELQQVYTDLKQSEKWLILFGCRHFLGLETIVKYNLDEIFSEMFMQINSAVGEPEKT